jgi:putative thioredoxin
MRGDDFATQPAPAAPRDTTTEGFRADVLEASMRKPVIVDFWAPWCAPCKQLAPVLERLVAATDGRAELVKMNIEEHPEIADQLGVKSIPAVVAFQRGRPLDGFVGALPESQIKGFLERLVGPFDAGGDELEIAEALIAEGDVEAAEALLTELALKEPREPKAIGALAQLLIAEQRFDDAGALLDTLPESLKRDPLLVAAAAALDNALQASGLGEIGELRRRAQQAPDDYQARFDLALALNAVGKRDEAATALLDIVRADRSWNDDGARKQLVQFFEAWGPADKATSSARRKLSSLLFS